MTWTRQSGDIVVDAKSLNCRSVGLAAHGQQDILIRVNSRELVQPAANLLETMIEYIRVQDRRIRENETFGYGFWNVRLKAAGAGQLEAWEPAVNGVDVVKGASNTLRYWLDQHAVCARFHAAFLPPRPDQLVVVSPGVFEGRPIRATRYPDQPQLSGWYVGSDLWDGNMASTRNEHLYHLTERRPEFAQYLALPRGWSVDLTNGEQVWFVEKTAKES